MPLVTRVQVPGMDTSAFEPVVFTLADGNKISLLFGIASAQRPTTRLQGRRHPTHFHGRSGRFFVQTDLSELEEQIKRQRRARAKTDTL
jgi:hypothetical protein